MKKIKIGLIISILFLLMNGCIPSLQEDEIAPSEEETKQETSIVPSYQLSKENYKMILPFRPSKARGVIVNQIENRIDIDEVEAGLRRHSMEAFDTEKYYFEEGQYITESMVHDWLGRNLTKEELEGAVQKEIDFLKRNKMTVNEDKIREELQQGLNPPINNDGDKQDHENNPRYLSHVLEQNFLVQKDDNTLELGGVSIALALKSVYSFQTETGGASYYEDISKEKSLEEGKKMAQQVLERLRKFESLQNVPIVIALFREEQQSSVVPGDFIAKTTVPANDMLIGDWDKINEEYVLFPSNRAKEKHFEDYELVNSFGNDISEYFPNYVGIVGEGFYIGDELQKLTITIPVEFYGSGEVIGFTQYAYGRVKEIFPDYYDLEVKVTSSDQMESIIYRKAGEEEPTVHILH